MIPPVQLLAFAIQDVIVIITHPQVRESLYCVTMHPITRPLQPEEKVLVLITILIPLLLNVLELGVLNMASLIHVWKPESAMRAFHHAVQRNALYVTRQNAARPLAAESIKQPVSAQHVLQIHVHHVIPQRATQHLDVICMRVPVFFQLVQALTKICAIPRTTCAITSIHLASILLQVLAQHVQAILAVDVCLVTVVRVLVAHGIPSPALVKLPRVPVLVVTPNALTEMIVLTKIHFTTGMPMLAMNAPMKWSAARRTRAASVSANTTAETAWIASGATSHSRAQCLPVRCHHAPLAKRALHVAPCRTAPRTEAVHGAMRLKVARLLVEAVRPAAAPVPSLAQRVAPVPANATERIATAITPGASASIPVSKPRALMVVANAACVFLPANASRAVDAHGPLSPARRKAAVLVLLHGCSQSSSPWLPLLLSS